jgi:4'-phosphopantetheinyl transferase
MISWLLRSSADHPALGRGEAPPGLLHPIEVARLAALRVPKRRQDWLLGRWTAKRLLQDWLQATTGESPPAERLAVLADPDGAPYAMLATEPAGDAEPETVYKLGLQRLSISLSISHSGQWGFCALCDDAGWSMGADIERIEPRQPGFAEMFFSPAERAHFDAADPDQRDLVITTTWCGKEAALKALRMGLRADTRQIICRLADVAIPTRHWSGLTIEMGPALEADLGSKRFAGWRAINEGYALALVVGGPDLPARLLSPATFD